MKFIILFLSLLFSYLSHAQNVVEWDVSFNSEKSEIEIKAIIQEGWHLYSQKIVNEIGPVPTSIEFDNNDKIELVGITEEPKPIAAYDETFDGEVLFFENNVVFTQHLKVIEPTIVKGVVTFMVCNNSMCLPPSEHEFKIEIEEE